MVEKTFWAVIISFCMIEYNFTWLKNQIIILSGTFPMVDTFLYFVIILLRNILKLLYGSKIITW